MSMVLALGSNLGDRAQYLAAARAGLSGLFQEQTASALYQSEAVDYLHQPPFLNQVIQYQRPEGDPHQVLTILFALEKRYGRTRDIPKGPRTLDIDLIFFGPMKMSSPTLQIPHPQWAVRSFVYWPLHELPAFPELKALFFRSRWEVANDLTPIAKL